MIERRAVLGLLAALGLLPLPASSQAVISAKSGLIHYVEGRVLLDGRQVQPKFGQFPHISPQSLLRTEAGRAEVLLSPGTFLRVAERTEFRLLSDRISDTALELLRGSVLIECAEMPKGSVLTVHSGQAVITIREDGLYRIDADPPELRVYGGQAVVESGGQAVTVKKGKAVALDDSLIARKFDVKVGDPFFRWSKRRAETIAMANLASARSLYESGVRLRSSSWYWNPYFGLFTFIPYRGIWSSPFGWRYYSPREVYVSFEPPRGRAPAGWDRTPRYDANLGYGTIRTTPAGTSGTVAASGPPAAASSGSAAPIRRESGSASGRPR
ncbi:MAG: FecR domain-containing protein [Bryobacteraceae bacterium]